MSGNGNGNGSGNGSARVAGAAGTAWGAVLFTCPDEVWQRVTGRGCTADEQLVTQLLGLRHLAQGIAELVAPGVVRRPAALVDVSHALSMVGLAAWRREYARPALASAGVALAGAALSRGGRRRR
ncbi:hypothetical protein [Intrasporangium sp. YIM S08009]|uniref:hypothetical protein n=1 Tax=Intrasporangium zincisolvens TaxID=3080018 RepID=UPI002B0596CF|nr:hypothetical protein [Intrasporangium sp. YIM S08009]